MRIACIQIYQKDLPITDGPYVMSTMTLSTIDSTIVKVTTDCGLVGWGEIAPLGPVYQPQHALGARAALCQMAPDLVGFEFDHPLQLHRRMDELLNGHAYAKAALDMAAWDLLGKSRGQRVCDLLGGAVREQVPAYYAVNKGDAEATLAMAKKKIAQGYKRLQIKVGGRSVSEDIEVIRHLWQQLAGQFELVVDANRALTPVQAVQLSQACADIPLLLEQPCDSMAETVSIAHKLRHPVALDESIGSLDNVLLAVQQQTCEAFGLKLTRVGGLTPMQSIRDICEARHLMHTMDDNWGGDLVAAACLHMAATVKPEILPAMWTACDYIAEHYDPVNGIAAVNGVYQLPAGPGLGIEPQADRIGTLVHQF